MLPGYDQIIKATAKRFGERCGGAGHRGTGRIDHRPPHSSPVLAIGSLAIDLAPAWVKDTVIALFGTGDKAFLLTLLLLIVAVAAAIAGIVELTRPPWGTVPFLALGVVAALAVTT